MAEEKIYTIPLREAYKKAEGKRAPYAARLIRSYLQTHTKAKTVKLGQELNKAIWSRSIRRPPRKVRIKAVKDGDIVRAELVGFEYKEFKALPKAEKKGAKEKLMDRLGPKAMKKEEEEKRIEGKETKTESKEEAKQSEKEETTEEAKEEKKAE